MKLGVFDSGIGGEAVATNLCNAFPLADIMVVNDKTNVPYGSKTPEQVRSLTKAAIQPLLVARCTIIILACNTATALAIEYLRDEYPDQTFIGLEPMIKPASILTQSKIVAVLATPATLASERYLMHKNNYQDITFYEPDCSEWALRIEANALERDQIIRTIHGCIEYGADVIVLGCTHYHWIRKEIEHAIDGAIPILDPSDAIVRRVQQLLG